MAWLSRIEKKKVSMITRAFGWEMSGDTPKGFVFGDRAYRVDGSTAPCGYKDPQMRQAYEPAGDLSVWLEASRFVTDQKRPELEVFLASAFAAPLTIFGGQHGCLLSIYGTTGGGKSTTLKIAQAVWGRPNKARQVLSSTENALSNILGKLANLPLYWDEIKEDHNYKKLTTMVFSVSMGKEKDRMHGDGSLRQPGEWHTLMGATMNACFTDYLTRTGKTDAAGLARVFEYRVEKKNDITGSGKHYDVDAMVGRLEYNHGGMGVAYAKMLVERAAQLQDLIITEGKAFDKLVNANQEERYWSKFCATTLVGAKFANELGCEFHLDSMRDFLVGIFMEMRGIISSEATQNNDSIEEMLTLFFKEYIDCILVTDTFVKHGGKVLKGMVKVISSPSQQHPKGVQIQWVAQDPLGDNKLLISLPTFHDWLDKRGRSRREAFRGLHHMYGAQKAQRTLGGGTTWAMGKERVYEMDVVHGSPLWVILKEKLGESRGALLVPVTPSDTPSDTTPTLAVA